MTKRPFVSGLYLCASLSPLSCVTPPTLINQTANMKSAAVLCLLLACVATASCASWYHDPFGRDVRQQGESFKVRVRAGTHLKFYANRRLTISALDWPRYVNRRPLRFRSFRSQASLLRHVHLYKADEPFYMRVRYQVQPSNKDNFIQAWQVQLRSHDATH